jgi:ectoine hydroxylase-related dioxygenase (phytanoyl-CoA dioxygenase family)
VLPDAHSQELADAPDPSAVHADVFADVPDAIDIPLAAGDLIIGDARLLHAAWPNNTDVRRTCVLAWHDVFTFPQPPTWWDGDIPEEVAGFDPSGEQPQGTRTPRRSAQAASASASWRPKL